jgi:uncharacterized protein YdeI (YjbR/CyaY-like superfamily)
MAKARVRRFKATLTPLGNGLGWLVARVPFDIAEVWPVRKGVRMVGTVEEVAFRASLMPYGNGGGHFLLVNKKMQRAGRLKAGETVTVTMEPDVEERAAAMPAELARLLKGERRVRTWFDGLTVGMRAYIANQITEPKSEAARARRAEQTAEWMMEVMEGELETPPMLRMAFQRHPQAKAGWEAMTKTQRRNHLMGILRPRSVEARERRLERMVEEALGVAEKKLGGPGRRAGKGDLRDYWV